MNTVSISKSGFGAGLQCHKRLWIEKHYPSLVPETSSAQQAIFDQGHEVGSWSHRLFPDGILLTNELDFENHLQASREALVWRRPLFEPAFSIPGAYARADILVPVGADEWDLLEVKSASNVWDGDEIKQVYLRDIAFQLYVYRESGLRIRRAFLVFLDRDYVRSGEVDSQKLFRREDVTREAEEILPQIPVQLVALAEVLRQEVSPELVIGPHCVKPYDCSLISHCWKTVPEDSVFTLVRAGAKAWMWWNDGIIRVRDLPQEGKYSVSQSIQIAAERTQKRHIDPAAVSKFLGGLSHPLSFLDFETVMPAVPLFDGCRPYGQIPFQFSLHFQESAKGDPVHFEFLSDGAGDPRPGFVEALRRCLGSCGSIVSYNSSFEMSRLRELAFALPQHAPWIESVLPRFQKADLLEPFRSFAVYDHRQHGSASIKAVLPAFSGLSYEDLAIQDGGTASRDFLTLLKGSVPVEQVSALRENLLAYCKRDTHSMVVLVDKLRDLSFSAGSAMEG